VNQAGDIRGTSITVAYKSLTGSRGEDDGLKGILTIRMLTKFGDGSCLDPNTMLSTSQPEQARMGHIPFSIQDLNVTCCH